MYILFTILAAAFFFVTFLLAYMTMDSIMSKDRRKTIIFGCCCAVTAIICFILYLEVFIPGIVNGIFSYLI